MMFEEEDAPMMPMTKAEACEALRQCVTLEGEQGHERADLVLLRLIDDAEVRRAFLAITRWYG